MPSLIHEHSEVFRCLGDLHNPIKAIQVAGLLVLLNLALGTLANAQAIPFVVERPARTIALEPYGPNIVRITMSTQKASATAPAGYGIVGTPSNAGWTREQDSGGYDVIRSGRMVVHVAPPNEPAPQPMPLDELNMALRKRYFGNFDEGPHPFNDTIAITTASGKPLLTMWAWSMVPNPAESSHAGKQDNPGLTPFHSSSGRVPFCHWDRKS